MSTVTLAPLSAVTWTEVEPGFHVASRGGEFAGFVEKTPDGSFVAFDEYSTPIGRFPALRDAQCSVTTTTTPANERRRARMRRATQTAAAVAGGVAGTMALTAGVLAPYL
jgi:hypothetical protein